MFSNRFLRGVLNSIGDCHTKHSRGKRQQIQRFLERCQPQLVLSIVMWKVWVVSNFCFPYLSINMCQAPDWGYTYKMTKIQSLIARLGGMFLWFQQFGELRCIESVLQSYQQHSKDSNRPPQKIKKEKRKRIKLCLQA